MLSKIASSLNSSVLSVVEPLERRALLSVSPTATQAQPVPGEGTGLRAAAVQNPRVTSVRPNDQGRGVTLDDFVAADVNLPNPGSGIDPSTLTSSTVSLVRTSDGKSISAVVNTSGGGDAIVLQPTVLLEAKTNYTFTVTSGLKDAAGASFIPFTSTFTTGTAKTNADPNINFDRISLSTATSQSFSTVAIGPDHKLYAAALSGHIFRYTINADGTLGQPQVIRTVINTAGEKRFVTGITFDANSTADNLILWVSHTQYAFDDGEDWTGKLTKVYGPNLEGYQDYVVGLPRSIRDHVTNQSAFGPDGKLYLMQAANTAMGGADSAWGMRQEHLLNAAVLQIDLGAIATRRKQGLGPLNVKTEGSGAYDPYSTGAPLKLYATGIRNGYDLVWADNGHLYVPCNGSAAGGTTPTGGGVQGSTNVQFTQPDYLYDVVQGGYYGHPNPARGEWVLDGGNLTSGADPYEVPTYPVGTEPDSNFRGAAYNFDTNFSPDGIIQYHGDAFGGRLDDRLLICQYSGGDNLISLTLDSKGTSADGMTGMIGTTHFVDPLDLTEDLTNGNLYVVEHGAGRITLLRPQGVSSPGGTPKLTTNSTRRIYNDVRGGAASEPRTVKIYNKGSSTLQITDLSFSGPDAGMFVITEPVTLPRNIAAGKSISAQVAFAGSPKKSLGIKTAQLNITSNDPNNPVTVVRLRGLSTAGEGGVNEPSLQTILDLYQIPLNVGDSNPSDVYLDVPPKTPNDEVTIQRLAKAGDGPVTIEALGVFGVQTDPAVIFGYYESGSPQNTTDLFRVSKSGAQSVNPVLNGSTAFDPGGVFGLYSIWPGFTNSSDGSTRQVYSGDSLNTWEPIAANRRKVRFYPMKNSDGSAVANAYVFAFEEYTKAYDQQDIVGIIRNVKVAPAGPELGIENTDGAPFNDRLVMSRIKNLNQTTPNVVHDIARVRIHNTGTSTLSIDSLTITGTFAINSGGTTPFTVAAGGTKDITIKFTATSGDIHSGTFTINSNDPDRPSRQVQLSGFWQSDSEANSQGVSQEPTLGEIGQLFGYTTSFVNSGQNLNGGGKVQAVGDEVLSTYWAPADPEYAVQVRQLVAYHQMPNTATAFWFAKGSSTKNTITTSVGVDAQTVLPRESTSTGALAYGQFKPGGAFGFKIDNESSDDTLNTQEKTGGNYGHHLRFYPARDRNGKYLANTYILAMDYNGINYDYQDNVYLISNVRPEKQLPAPQGATAYGTGTGVHLDWADPVNSSNLGGYYISRATSKTGSYAALNTTPITSSFYDDLTNISGRTLYYRIVAVDKNGLLSGVASTSTFRSA